MAKIFFSFGLAEQSPTVRSLTAPPPILADAAAYKASRVFADFENAEIDFSHEFLYGELLVVVNSITTEIGFEFNGRHGGNAAAQELFLLAKRLLESDSGFCNAAFEEVREEYDYSSRGANDPEAKIARRKYY